MDEGRGEEAALIFRCRKGDGDAIRELVGRYEASIFHIIWRTVGNVEDARDLAQETFIKAIRALDTYDVERPFRNWIFRIASNLAIDHLRRRRLRTVSIDIDESDEAHSRMRAPALVDPGERPDEASARGRLAEDLARLVDMLPPDYRIVIQLRHREQLSYEEIADTLGIPLGTVKARLHRAHHRLRELWTGEARQGHDDEPDRAGRRSARRSDRSRDHQEEGLAPADGPAEGDGAP